MRVERTRAPVIQMFLSLTRGGQDAVDAAVRRDLHLQTRIAKHLEAILDTGAGSMYRVANSPFHDKPDKCTENHLDTQ